jgi:hypothetical protein
MDSGFWSTKTIRACRRPQIRSSITVRQTKPIRAAIAAIDEDAWTQIGYPDGGLAQVAETRYQGDRLIVRRTRLTGAQAELFPNWRYHALVTDRVGTTVELDQDHRRHATVELAIRDLKAGVGLRHCPSGKFAANAAWLVIAMPLRPHRPSVGGCRMRGSIKKRGSTYTYVVDIGPDPLTGKRRQRTKGGFRTRKECLQALNDVIAAARAGTLVEPAKRTVESFLVEEWLPAVKPPRVRESTWLSYQLNIQNHIVPNLGRMNLQGLTPGQLTAFYRHLLTSGRRDGKGGLAPKTVKTSTPPCTRRWQSRCAGATSSATSLTRSTCRRPSRRRCKSGIRSSSVRSFSTCAPTGCSPRGCCSRRPDAPR